MNKIRITEIITVALALLMGCSVLKPGKPSIHASPGPAGKMPGEIAPDITIVSPGFKICQLVGEYDRQQERLTQNRTDSRYHLQSTDLGVPFQYAGRTYLLFGDTNGGARKDGDAIAYTADTSLENGLSLRFIHDSSGTYKPVTIPGIGQGAFEVSTEGVEVNSRMYIYSTTDHSASVAMGRSVVSRSDDSGHTFCYLYSLSTLHFINLSLVKVNASQWKLPDQDHHPEDLILFGSGTYRRSDVYLAYQPSADIERPEAIRYFSGMDDWGRPVWSSKEKNAVPLFDQPCVGELSVSYNKFVHRWILLYNCTDKINMRTAKYPWGPWTKPQILFDPWKDGGYCHFMHVSWKERRCDSVMDPGRENTSGGVYGPYQFKQFATGDSAATHPSTTIYFTMSIWNPYTVVLMKSTLAE